MSDEFIAALSVIAIIMSGTSLILSVASMLSVAMRSTDVHVIRDSSKDTKQSSGPMLLTEPKHRQFTQQAPELPPDAIAPSIKKPPKPPGGFGSKVDG